MKPSELIKSYILSKQLPKKQNELSKYFECCFERLDNNFIDQEELKDKINKEFELHRTIFKCKAVFTEKGFNNLKKKILELLK